MYGREMDGWRNVQTLEGKKRETIGLCRLEAAMRKNSLRRWIDQMRKSRTRKKRSKETK